jgi:glyoxylase-like metal-dependent hydrolase (beta-lactamase superfamily II)
MTPTSRRIGPYEIAILVDGLFEGSTDILTHAAGPEALRSALARWDRSALKFDVNCFVLRGPEGVVLIDTGAGSEWGPAFGRARDLMSAAGIEREAVRRVLLTHIHSDHAFGLFAGEDPYFPNAEVWVPERDFAFFTDAAARERTPAPRRGGFAIAERLTRAYGERMKRIADGPIMAGVEAMPLPGHTPGQTGYLLRDDAETLLIWGDALHVEDIQPSDPEIGVVFDLDPATAARTRRDTLTRAAEEGWIVAGGHIHGFQRATRFGAGFALSPA